MVQFFSLSICLLGLSSALAQAGDLSSEVRQGVSGPATSNGGYFEMGAIARAYVSPLYGYPENNRGDDWHKELGLTVNGRYEYNHWFVEAFSEGLEQFTLGYNAVNGDNWALDVVGLQEHGEMTEDESEDFKKINKRAGDYTLGLRSTWYWQKAIVQAHALTDVSGTHQGQIYSIKIARHWLYHNWNFHGIIGATYRSANAADYYFSIHPDEASAELPEYKVGAGTLLIYEVGASYPLSDKWVFRSLARRVDVPRQWLGSPLFVGDKVAEVATSLSYVF